MAGKLVTSSGLVNGRRLRVTRLDGCGRPVFADDSVAVTKGFVSVAYSANTNDADDVDVTNADGDHCMFVKGSTTLSGYGLEIEFCGVDPSILGMMTGQPVRLSADGSRIVGFNVDTKIDMSDSGVALELWSGATDSATACSTGAGPLLGYFLTPFAQGGILGDFTVAQGAINFTWTGANTTDGNSWGVGPYNVVADADGDPGPLNESLTGTTAIAFEFTSITPPDQYAGLRPLMDPTSIPLTEVTGSPDGLEVAFTVQPNSIIAAVWYDFGDGTWDYLDPSASGATSHTYAEEDATYTVRATSDGNTWVTTQVTTGTDTP